MASRTRTERILVFIPAYNCERQIGRVLAQLQGNEALFSEVIVVDNRSPDNTVDAAIAAAKNLQLPVRVVRNVDNLGLGGSHKSAFAYAARAGHDYVVVLHGDDQGSIADLVPHIQAGEHRGVDCLLGARFMPGSQLENYSAFRTFGNEVFNLLFSAAAGKRLYDLGSGLNMYRVGAVRDLRYHGFADNLTFNYYMILATVYRRWKIRFFPISWREDDQISNVKLARQSMQVLQLLATFVFRRRRFLEGSHTHRAADAYRFETVFDNGVPVQS
ncbi:glycosyltransferase family 2 protein [Caballeronia sp. LZ062]|uniref:glycosyltransferase family 2 protein n=1 Tax=unclassified Caballeronia TaxID=2646786 RepID=UPI00285C0AC9|nr:MULTISPECIES: glycosyltransferase family 2 protein [unclassified Caballeronia]MDR5855195.1 glycosyltransferase family 2 protein [Caballeronia sp. LZ050]MDR5870275.1 glycosyltransferase family 2 protein [Caballeronia sp. LZ062]